MIAPCVGAPRRSMEPKPPASMSAPVASSTSWSGLRVRITLPAKTRSFYYTIDAILNDVNRISATRLRIGNMPTNLSAQTGVVIGANNEVARDVLVRALAATGVSVSWRLFCAALTPNSWCFLSLHTVRPSQ